MRRLFESFFPVVSVCLLALVLRIPLLNGSFWLDEAAQALESVRPWSQQLQIAYDFQPPLFHLIVHVFLQFSHVEWWVRVPSLIAGVATVGLTYVLARRVATVRIAWLATALFALNSFHIFYSQELRPYSLAAFFGIVSCVLLSTLLDPSSDRRRWLWGGYVLSLIAGLYTMYVFPFLLFGHVVIVLVEHVYLVQKRNIAQVFTTLRPWILAWGAASLAFLPWVPSFLEQLHVGSVLRAQTVGWDQVVSIPQLKALPLTLAKFLYGVIDLQASVFILVSSIVLGVTMVYFLPQLKNILLTKKGARLTAMIVIPLLSAWLVSFVIPVVQPKRVLFLLPMMYVLGAYGADKLVRAKTRITPLILFYCILVGIHLHGTIAYWSDTRLQRENWRVAIETIDQQYSSNRALVIFRFDDPFAPWQWYPHQEFPVIATGTKTVTSVDQVRGTLTPALAYDQLIVFDYLADLTDPQRRIEQWLAEYGYVQAELYDYPQIGFIRVFRRGTVVGDR